MGNYYGELRPVGQILKEKNIQLANADPVSRGGFTQIPNFILKKEGLSSGAKVIYAMFLHYAWHNEFCFPGQDRLAKDIGMSRSRVTEYIGELERAELITIRRRGQGKTNLYKIHFRVRGKKEGSKDVQMSKYRLQEVEVATSGGRPVDGK